MCASPPLQEQLRRLTGEARRRHATIGKEIDRQRDRPPEPGDLFLLAETAEQAVEWAILDRDPDDPQWLLVVPADTESAMGNADVGVAADAPRGPLSLHCAHARWLEATAFDVNMRTGFLEPMTLELARRKRLELNRTRAGALVPGATSAAEMHQADDPGIYSAYQLDIRDKLTRRQIWCGSDLAELSAIQIPEGNYELRLLRPARRPGGEARPPDLEPRKSSHPVANQHDMTRLLQRWHGGDKEALDSLMPIVVGELRRIARGHFAREMASHTLQPTALVNEVYLRLVDAERIEWQGRAHFFGISARLMRRVLVDHARSRRTAKRGGGAYKTAVEVDQLAPASREVDLLALDEALEEMSRTNPDGSRIVEMRYFTGLTLEEIAEVMGVSRTTVKRKWHAARLWLLHELSHDGAMDPPPGGNSH